MVPERGWRIAKEKNSKKIDAIVAPAMACRSAVEHGPDDDALLLLIGSKAYYAWEASQNRPHDDARAVEHQAVDVVDEPEIEPKPEREANTARVLEAYRCDRHEPPPDDDVTPGWVHPNRSAASLSTTTKQRDFGDPEPLRFCVTP
ncbi:MAG TPA: hypothetical protein VGL62_08620 [Vicinamibacterales bacterium]